MTGGKERTPNKSSTPDRKSQSPKPVVKPPHLKGKKFKQNNSNVYLSLMQYATYLILPIIFGVAGFYWHHNYIYLPSLVNTPSNLAKILPDNYMKSAENADKFWGTYRANCYFGMKTRSPTSPVMGLVWYTQPKADIIMPRVRFVISTCFYLNLTNFWIVFRHWCSQQDGLSKYGWLEHDGRTFGIQEILDDGVTIKTSFVKRGGGDHGGDWTMRLEAVPTVSSACIDVIFGFMSRVEEVESF